MGTNTYYILFTCSENNNIKIESILTSLSNQIENYPFNSKNKNIRILACKDTIELPIKKELLLKEVHSPFYVFLDETDDVPDTYIEEMMLKWDNTVKNAVVTACNSKYFRSCLTLITSLFKHSNNDIDFIYVFDLGLTHSEQNVLSTIKKVIFIPMIEILMYTHTIRTIFPEFLTPNMFAWKPLFIRFVFEHSDIQNVFWLDSGIVTFGNIKFIFEHIKKYGCWLTEDGFVNHNFTHAVCKEIMQANDEEMEGTQLLAGLSGFNKDKGLDILHKWCHFCLIKE